MPTYKIETTVFPTATVKAYPSGGAVIYGTADKLGHSTLQFEAASAVQTVVTATLQATGEIKSVLTTPIEVV